MSAKKNTPEPTTVYHPTAVGVTRTVDNPDEWRAAGWLLAPSKVVREAEAEVEAPKAETKAPPAE